MRFITPKVLELRPDGTIEITEDDAKALADSFAANFAENLRKELLGPIRFKAGDTITLGYHIRLDGVDVKCDEPTVVVDRKGEE